jgi:uncharacterized membrane protein
MKIKNKIISWLREWYPLLLILSLALYFRIHLLLIRGTYWFDEMFSLHFANLPWQEALKYWALETNPPLYTLFLRFWSYFTNSSAEIIIRLPSIIFGITTIVLLYYFCLKALNKKTAIVASLSLALSGIHIFISSEARVYSLLALLTISSYFLFYQIFFNNKKSAYLWTSYFLINLLLIYSHLTALSIFLVQFLSLFLQRDNGKKIKKWFAGHISIALMWSVWFIPSFLSKINGESLGAWYFNPEVHQYANILTLLVSNFINNNLTPFIFTTFGTILIVALGFVVVKTKDETNENKKRLLVFLQVWAYLLIFVGSIMGVFITKFYIISSLSLYILIGYSVSQVAKTKKTFSIIILFILLSLLPSAYEVSSSQVFSWKELTNHIETQETQNSITIVTPFNEILPIQKYYQGNRPLLGIYLRDDDLSLEERIVRYNWNQQITDKKTLENWLLQNIEKADKVFYIQYTENFDWIHQVFIENGWRLKHSKRPRGYVNLYLFEFHAPNYSSTSTPAS